MPTAAATIALGEQELREIAGYAADCARRVLAIFEGDVPGDTRPRDAIDAAYVFAGGGRRTGALRQRAWAAYRAAREAASPAAVDAARAASQRTCWRRRAEAADRSAAALPARSTSIVIS